MVKNYALMENENDVDRICFWGTLKGKGEWWEGTQLIEYRYIIRGGEEILQIANWDDGNLRGKGLGCERNRWMW